jgi:hypothetical protein
MSNYHTNLDELNARMARIETRLVKLMIHAGMEAPGLPTRRPMDIPRDYARPTNTSILNPQPNGVLRKLREALGK